MKIIGIKITLENKLPLKEDQTETIIETIELERNQERIWYVNSDQTSRRGLFPYEIRLANMLQEFLEKFNKGAK